MLERWPATLHPDLAERCYYSARARSRTWVEGLVTRGGSPRWARLAVCGDPVVVIRTDGAVSWEHRWCRDRACYACARSRSRKLAESLRLAVPTRDLSRLHFVTLTRRKVQGETAGQAWDAWVACWARLRHSGAWDGIVGGVRSLEVTWSDGHERAKHRIAGWHAHAHLLIEVEGTDRVACMVCSGTGWQPRAKALRCATCSSATVRGDGTLNATLAGLLTQWAAIVDGECKAQNAVALDATNVGQLAKYITKMWDLRADKAKALFHAAAGRRVVEGFGAWRRFRRWGEIEKTPHGWYASGVALRDVERLRPSALVNFECRVPGVRIESGDPSSDAGYIPRQTVAQVSAGRIVSMLQRDPRPVWERVDETTPGHLERCAWVRQALRDNAAHEYGHAGEPPESQPRAGPATVERWEF